MDKFFTAIYEKERSIIIDISLKSNSEKIGEIESFLEKRGVIKYVREEVGDILTILVYFDKLEEKESRSFLDNFHEFIS